MDSWDLQKLVDQAKVIIENKGFIGAIDDIMKLIEKEGPTGKNIVKSIKKFNPSLKAGKFMFNK